MRAISIMRIPSAQWTLIGLVTLLLFGSVANEWRHGGGPRDFGDFYCAGAAKNAGGNPYLWKDLDACGAPGRTAQPSFTEAHRPPAPVPGYDVALFAALAKMTYMRASYLWLVLCTVAMLATVALLSKTVDVPPLIVFAAIAMIFRMAVSWGQLPPLVIALLSFAAYAIARRAYVAAGIAAACTLIEPHLGVPICLAAFLWIPQTRVTLAIACVALAGISVATLGVAENLAYFRSDLPLHLLAEAPSNAQFSLTWLLYFFGVGEGAATQAGKISYFIAVALGILGAKKFAAALGRPEFIPVIPAAAAVIGGPFIHIVQIDVAIVCALMLAGRRNMLVAWSSVALLSGVWYTLPWTQHPWNPVRIESGLAFAAIVAYALKGRSLRSSANLALVAAAAFVGYVAITAAVLHAPSGAFRSPEALQTFNERVGTLRDYASAAWGVSIHSPTKFSSLRDLLGKFPIWLGLAFVVVAACLEIKYAGRLTPAATRDLRPERAPVMGVTTVT